jgi:hypothetical protein
VFLVVFIRQRLAKLRFVSPQDIFYRHSLPLDGAPKANH